jgi:hypothetical protein
MDVFLLIVLVVALVGALIYVMGRCYKAEMPGVIRPGLRSGWGDGGCVFLCRRR